MTEVKIASRTCPDEFGRPRTFHYALTVDTVESDTFSCENYGVRISEESGDTAAIPGITTSAVRIDELLTLLVEHGVQPHSTARRHLRLVITKAKEARRTEWSGALPLLHIRTAHALCAPYSLFAVVDLLHQTDQQGDHAQHHKDTQHTLAHHLKGRHHIIKIHR